MAVICVNNGYYYNSRLFILSRLNAGLYPSHSRQVMYLVHTNNAFSMIQNKSPLSLDSYSSRFSDTTCHVSLDLTSRTLVSGTLLEFQLLKSLSDSTKMVCRWVFRYICVLRTYLICQTQYLTHSLSLIVGKVLLVGWYFVLFSSWSAGAGGSTLQWLSRLTFLIRYNYSH